MPMICQLMTAMKNLLENELIQILQEGTPMGGLRGLFGSALDHRSLPPEFESRGGISEGCFIFDFASLPLTVDLPI